MDDGSARPEGRAVAFGVLRSCGHSSASTFSTAFSRHVGQPPQSLCTRASVGCRKTARIQGSRLVHAHQAGPSTLTVEYLAQSSRLVSRGKFENCEEPMAATPTEETFEGTGGLKIFLRSWRPQGAPRAALVICHGVNSHGGQYTWPAEQFVKQRPGRLRARSARPRQVRGRALLRRERRRLCRATWPAPCKIAKSAASRPAGVPARPQRRRRRLGDLRARQPGRARRVHLRELRVPGAGARLCPGGHQGPEPHRPAAAGAEAEERGLLARSEGGRGPERRPARPRTRCSRR